MRPAPTWPAHASSRLLTIVAVLSLHIMPVSGSDLGRTALQAPSAQEGERVREALPLEVALSVRGHNHRSPVNLSGDGVWLAHTIATDDTVSRDSGSRRFAVSGFPFAEGDSRMEATVTRVADRESIRLGGETSSSWAAVWSPDGRRVAFYSDEGGEAGLWIWDLATREAVRFPGVIVRPAFGFEMPRWSADGGSVLVKILPGGMSLAEANALGRRRGAAVNSPDPNASSRSVRVRSVVPRADTEESTEQAVAASGRRAPVGDMSPFVADLALVELGTGAVRRLVQGVPVRDYAFAPDGSRVAYTVLKGYEPASQQPNFDLVVQELTSGATLTLGTDLRLGYGIEWSWSPDSRQLSWIPSGPSARLDVAAGAIERLMLASVDSGDVTAISDKDAPTFDPGDGEHRPLWDALGEKLYAVGQGELWQADRESGALLRVAGIPGWRILSIVSGSHDDTIWTTGDGRTIWVLARSETGARSGIYAVEVDTGRIRAALDETKTYGGIFSVDASSASGEIVFVSTDQQHPYDIWTFDTDTARVRQASSINPKLEHYQLGEARVIKWLSLDGETLAGSLLLPPGYQSGERLPLVVWVYAGTSGSKHVNRFGLAGIGPTFNMHVLATRGYAVLFPDAPVRVGSPAEDVMRTVMPGVNAAIEQGYADPERLAIMGQSYGSYNTLAIITQTKRFKAAVITAAVIHPDLFAGYLGSPGYYEQGQGNMGGSIWEFPQRYLENSPLFRFDQIETPLLIGQGALDGDLVPSEAIFSALERLDKAVEYRVYEGEGHVITQRSNVLDFWRRRLMFLAEHLDLQIDTRVDGLGSVSPARCLRITPQDAPSPTTQHASRR